MKIEKIEITSDTIKLDQFLKLASAVYSGSEAKKLIIEGKILVNDEIEFRRGRKLIPGDRIKTPVQNFILHRKGPE